MINVSFALVLYQIVRIVSMIVMERLIVENALIQLNIIQGLIRKDAMNAWLINKALFLMESVNNALMLLMGVWNVVRKIVVLYV